MAGKSSNTTTTTQTNQPYKAAQPLLDQGMGDALNLYKNGGLVRPNTMSTVVPMSNQTMTGIGGQENAIANLTRTDVPIARGAQLWNTIGAGGFNKPQQTALAGLTNTATGSFDINANPAYAGVRQRAMDAARDAVGAQAAEMGRSGSPVHQGTLAREVGTVAGNLDFQQFQDFQNRQSAAQQQLFNAGQMGHSNLDAAADSLQQPFRDLQGIGGQFEDLMGRQMNDQLRVSNELSNLPLANLQALLAAASGAGSFGTQTQKAQMPSSGLSNALGLGLGGLSLLGSL